MKLFRSLLLLCFAVYFCSGTLAHGQGRADAPIRVVVDLVQLNVAVTDKKGNYVTGLQPGDFTILEDGIPQTVATFAEGGGPTHRLAQTPAPNPAPESQSSATEQNDHARVTESELQSMLTGANVFVLFDTSNYMYRGFVFAQDAISDFVRSLDGTDRVAFYSYSRDLSRAARLTSDRSQVLRAVRATVAGDDAALYNCLLLAVKDAAQSTGRKVIVVFSNGPDNASVVPPEDVAELAQSTGTAIYMICTRQAQLEPISTAVFERMTADTGGKVYFAKNWRDEEQAFESIKDDLAHLYSLSYYPRPNPNRGWRSITVKLNSERLKSCHIRTRNGYRLLPSQFPNTMASLEAQPHSSSAR
ncbi:MAG TPA: VWA domain-containing protein [Candidatus Eremiobacteraceae bacterium]|nr:VWA domain-containing protein [Candidatus Eremiobacteraceae bacterium]